MFPLRDNLKHQYPPLMVKKIIFYATVIFLIQSLIIRDKEAFFNTFGLIPNLDQINLPFTQNIRLWPYFTHMFLHGSFSHLLGNLWTLWIFGPKVEDKMGKYRFLSFYLLCGLCSATLHMMIYPQSTIPVIGASGAISGIMGAYFILYPKSQILMFFPIFFIPYFFTLPAVMYLAFWFLMQFLYAGLDLTGSQSTTGIAWWAHVGGFLAGIIFHKLFVRAQLKNKHVGYFK